MLNINAQTKGFAVTIGKRVFGRYFIEKSLGLTFVEPLFNRHLLLSILVIYDRQDRFVAKVSSNVNSTLIKEFRNLYIRKSFPYASFSCDLEKTYKIFCFKFAWIKGNDDYTISVDNKLTGDERKVCDVMFVSMTNDRQFQENLNYTKLSELSKKNYDDAKIVARIALGVAIKKNDANAKIDQLKVYAALRVNHPFIRKGLRSFVTKTENDSSHPMDLTEKINNLLDPFVLGPHGFSRRLSSISDEKLHSSITLLLSFIEDNGAKAFLNSGTLLGARRSGDMLPHDDDLDLAVYISGENENEIVEGWNKLRRKFRESFAIIEKGTFFSVDILDGIEIDLFPAWSIDGKAYIYPYCSGEISDEDLLPLSEVSLRTHCYPAPRKIDSVLEVNYGPNWQQPDPYWKFDWETAKKNFKRIKLLFEEAI